MKALTTIAFLLATFVPGGTRADAAGEFFEHNYAVVVGIDSYANASWPKLNYAVSDAKAIAQLLRTQGFQVTEIIEREATKAAILAALDDKLAPILGENDRVVLFFAGHGTSRVVGNAEHGYLIPADAGDSGSFSSFIPLTAIHDLSETMAAAKHQLFILDSCFGGLASMRSGGNVTIDPRTPNYLYEISRRKARQLLTAGGKDQQVRDGGSAGHSFFAGALIKAVQDGMADVNGDGYVTFNELTAYIVPAATSYNQTPGVASLAGHQLGEFWLTSMSKPSTPAASQDNAITRSPINVYAPLRAGKQAFLAIPPNYNVARQQFLLSANEGNAEAMNFLGKLYWDGLGVPKSPAEATRWLELSAERGNTGAMENLTLIYGYGPTKNNSRLKHWQQALSEARRLEASITIDDPSGQAASGDLTVPRENTRILIPRAPTGVSVQ